MATPSVVPATPTATPLQPLTVAAAAKLYLSLATAANKESAALYAKYGSGNFKSVVAYDAWAKASAADLRRSADSLRKAVWPPEAASDVKSLLAKLAAEEVAYLEAATAKSWSQVVQLDAASSSADTARTNLSNLVRADLGLPSVPIK